MDCTHEDLCAVHRADIRRVRRAYLSLIGYNYPVDEIEAIIAMCSSVMLDMGTSYLYLDDANSDVIETAALRGRYYEAAAVEYLRKLYGESAV